LNKKLKKVLILQINYSLEKIGLVSDRVRRFGVTLSGGRGVKKHPIFLSTTGINYWENRRTLEIPEIQKYFHFFQN
jgi:hypothetical protein